MAMAEYFDRRTRRYRSPARLVAAAPEVRNAEILLERAGFQPTVRPVPGAQLPPGGWLLCDYGCEHFGGVRCVTGRAAATFAEERPLPVRITLGESVSEALGTPDNQHAMHDFTVELPPMGRAEFGQSAFRFVRIENCDPEKMLDLRELSLVVLERDLECRGKFHCDDPLLDAIWSAAGRTIHLCLQEYLWDGAKRDQLVWMGDMHPELLAVAAIFGREQTAERSMDYMRDETPLPGFMNNMPGYSLCWLLCQHDWYWLYGDSDYLQSQQPYLAALLELLCRKVEINDAEFLDRERFIDWAHFSQPERLDGGFHALLVRALSAGQKLVRILGEEELDLRLAAALKLLRGRPVEPGAAKSVAAMRVLAGLEEAKGANAAILACDPLCGVTPFHGLYLLQARAMAGDIAGCFDLMRGYWGTMLKLGATTFWEHFEVDWAENAGRIDELPEPGRHDVHREYGEDCFMGLRHSLCHGWGAGVAFFMAQTLLGVRIAAPGAGKVLIAPQLHDLKEVSGVFPTVHGDIAVRHWRTWDGAIATEVAAPPGIEVTVAAAEDRLPPVR